MNVICNNCSKIGHTFSECVEPVNSYGIIIFRYILDKPEILMINRKNSLCYIEFIRGKYNINNPRYILVLFNKFSMKEKENIMNKSFDELWMNLWLLDNLNNQKYEKDYTKSKEKFNKLKKGVIHNNKLYNIESLMKDSITEYLDTEWEFPKGRKNNNEKNINCAIRECSEETNFTIEDYELLINVAPLTELYTGENKIKYRHIYYIAELKNYEKGIVINSSKNQSIEIGDIKWFSKEESLNKLRNYHKSRFRVINCMFDFLENIEDYIII